MLIRVHNVALIRRGFVVESNRFRISPRVHIFFVPHVCKTITSRIVSVEKAAATKQQQKKEKEKGWKALRAVNGENTHNSRRLVLIQHQTIAEAITRAVEKHFPAFPKLLYCINSGQVLHKRFKCVMKSGALKSWFTRRESLKHNSYQLDTGWCS